MLRTIDKTLNQEIGIKILRAPDPLNAVALGALKVFDDDELLKELRVIET